MNPDFKKERGNQSMLTSHIVSTSHTVTAHTHTHRHTPGAQTVIFVNLTRTLPTQKFNLLPLHFHMLGRLQHSHTDVFLMQT